MQEVADRRCPGRNRRLGGTPHSVLAGRGSWANVVLPRPGYPPFSALPESLRIETRYYAIRKENDFRIDLEEIKRLVDRNTKLILMNSPHNPTGATISDAELDSLHEFTASREIQLVSDEVYHPIYHRTGDKIGFPSAACDRHP